jgi:hypothetical protein
MPQPITAEDDAFFFSVATYPDQFPLVAMNPNQRTCLMIGPPHMLPGRLGAREPRGQARV